MTWTQRGSVLEASDAADSDQFGVSLSLSSDGNKLVVSALAWEGAAGTDRGGVYTYTRNGSTWDQVGSVLEASDAADLDSFGANVCLSSDGLTLVVSTFVWEGATGNDRGGVYTYDWNSGTSSWDQRGSVLEASDAADLDQFGRSVYISGDGNKLVVGAQNWEGAAGTNRGGVYTYTRNGSTWDQVGSILEGANDSDQFGRDVSISEDGLTLVVGAQGYSTVTGAVYTYDWNSGTSSWDQRGSILQADDATTNYGFGSGVAISDNGNVLAVGSFLRDVGGFNRGGVYIYDRSGSTWTKRGSTLLSGDIADDDRFGVDVSFSHRANVLAVGAQVWEGATGTSRGGVYIYDSSDKILGLTKQTYTQTNNTVSLLSARKTTIDSTSYSLTLADVGLTYTIVGIIFNTTPYSATTNNINLLFGRNQIIDTTSFTQTNNDISFLHGYQIVLDSLPYSLTNNAINLLVGRTATITNSSYSLSLNDILLSHGYNLPLVSSSYTLTYSDLSLLLNRKSIIDSANYILTDNDILFSRGYFIPINSSSYTLTNNTIGTLVGRLLILDNNNYTLTENDIPLYYNRFLLLDNSNISLSLSNINFLLGKRLLIDSNTYSISNNVLNLLYNRLININSTSHTLDINDINLLFGRTISLDQLQCVLNISNLNLLNGRRLNLDKVEYLLDTSLNLLYDRIFQLDQQSYILTINPLDSIYSYPLTNTTRLLIMKASP